MKTFLQCSRRIILFLLYQCRVGFSFGTGISDYLCSIQIGWIGFRFSIIWPSKTWRKVVWRTPFFLIDIG